MRHLADEDCGCLADMSEIALSRPVRVVIVDDTRSIRAMIRAMLSQTPMIEVVGEAGDPYEARELIRNLNPDVITLDVVMPRMDGLSFLERIMRLRPMPVVMVSTRTTEKSQEAVKALSLGAFDCVDIAKLGEGSPVNLAETVLQAAQSNTRGLTSRGRTKEVRQLAAQKLNWNGKVVVIGSSTGGVDALLTVLASYPVDCPPTVIAQHMPSHFLESFARRLDTHLKPKVVLAADGAKLEQGTVHLAPGGDSHVEIAPTGPLRLRTVPDVGEETYIPSVDVLFSSAAKHARQIVGVMLTGMGRDGADAMLKLREEGGRTIVQDSASCVVDGMPKAARDIGAAMEIASLDMIGGHIIRQVSAQPAEVGR